MTICEGNIVIRRGRGIDNAWFECQLEKDHKGKHRFEGKSEGKLFKVEWWDELPVIEGLSEIYKEDGLL
jgi:hypothetical protein